MFRFSGAFFWRTAITLTLSPSRTVSRSTGIMGKADGSGVWFSLKFTGSARLGVSRKLLSSGTAVT